MAQMNKRLKRKRTRGHRIANRGAQPTVSQRNVHPLQDLPPVPCRACVMLQARSSHLGLLNFLTKDATRFPNFAALIAVLLSGDPIQDTP